MFFVQRVSLTIILHLYGMILTSFESVVVLSLTPTQDACRMYRYLSRLSHGMFVSPCDRRRVIASKARADLRSKLVGVVKPQLTKVAEESSASLVPERKGGCGLPGTVFVDKG